MKTTNEQRAEWQRSPDGEKLAINKHEIFDLLDDIETLAAEKARLRLALGQISGVETVWSAGSETDIAAVRRIARAALSGETQ